MTSVTVDVSDLFGNVQGADFDELMRRAEQRDERGYNYLEVSRPKEDYPMLNVKFHGPHAVVSYFPSLDEDNDGPSILQLAGDSSVSPDEVMEFFMPGSPEEFSGDAIVSAATAAKFLKAFATGAPWPDAPSWTEA